MTYHLQRDALSAVFIPYRSQLGHYVRNVVHAAEERLSVQSMESVVDTHAGLETPPCDETLDTDEMLLTSFADDMTVLGDADHHAEAVSFRFDSRVCIISFVSRRSSSAFLHVSSPERPGPPSEQWLEGKDT